MEVLEAHVEVVLMEDHAEEDLVEDHVVVDMLEVHAEEGLFHSDVVEVGVVAAAWLTAVSKLVVVVAVVVVVVAGGQVAEPEVLRNKIKIKQKEETNLGHLYTLINHGMTPSQYQSSGNVE